MTMDLKDFYLMSNLPEPKFLQIPRYMIPDKIMDLYNLHELVHNNHVYMELQCGMYGLPQAGRLAMIGSANFWSHMVMCLVREHQAFRNTCIPT